MADFTPSGFGGRSSRPGLLSQANQSSNDRAMADERAIAADKSTATLERHVSKVCSGIGNKSVGTSGVLAGGGAVVSSVRTLYIEDQEGKSFRGESPLRVGAYCGMCPRLGFRLQR